MAFRLLGIFILISIVAVGCGNDANFQAGEDEYFEDYEAPENKWGYIDTTGNMKIEPIYDDLRPFNNGLAIANYKGKWGFIDKNGEAVVAHKFRSAFPFKEGLARIQNFEKKYGYIDRAGKMMILDTFGLAFDFNSGLARALQGNVYGYIDKSGKWAIAPLFESCGNFQNGYAIVKQYGKHALIDSKGTYIIDFKNDYDKIYKPANGIIRLKKGKQYYYAELTNQDRLYGPYKKALDFNDEGFGAVMNDGQWSIIDKKFVKSNSFEASSVQYAGQNKWLISKNNKMGLVNHDGTTFLEPKYKMLYSFQEGRAAFEEEGFWGFLGMDGQVKIPAIFPLTWAFNEGYGRMINKGYIGYINKDGKLAFQNGFRDAHDFSEGYAHVQP